MKNISFSFTTPQFRARTKDVTRRVGWANLKVGDRLMGCEKCMGRKAGQPLVRLGVIEVVDVRREPLNRMTKDVDYGLAECKREGFGDDENMKWPSSFVGFFIGSHKGCTPETLVTRIEFRHVTFFDAAGLECEVPVKKVKPPRPMPEWFGKAIARATAEDAFNALPKEKKDEIDKSLGATGVPPDWFIVHLKSLGLNFRDPLVPAARIDP